MPSCDRLPFMPWYPGDWRASLTRAVLPPLGRLAYREILDAMWLEDGCCLPDDPAVLFAVTGLTMPEWESVKDAVLTRIPVRDGKRHHPRLSAEFDKVRAKRSAAVAGGEARAASTPPEKRVEIAKKAAESRWSKNHMLAGCLPMLAIPDAESDTESEAEAEKKNQRTPSESCRQEPTRDRGEKSVSVKTGSDLPPFALAWNRVVDGSPLPKVTKWTPARARALKARLDEEPDTEVWERAMVLLRDSPHHRGMNDRGWVANVDFLLQAGQGIKWVEKARGGPASTMDPGIARILDMAKAMGGGM